MFDLGTVSALVTVHTWFYLLPTFPWVLLELWQTFWQHITRICWLSLQDFLFVHSLAWRLNIKNTGINGGDFRYTLLHTLYFQAYGQTFINDDYFLALVGSISSIFNCLMRPVWGIIMDKYGFQVTLQFTAELCICCASLYLHVTKVKFIEI